MTRIVHYFGWLLFSFRMGAQGWDYRQFRASRLFASKQMEENRLAAEQQQLQQQMSSNQQFNSGIMGKTRIS